MSEEENRAERLARLILDSILKEYRRLDKARDKGRDSTVDKIRCQWAEKAYGVQVRSDWETPRESLTPAEYNVTLAGGGPACRIYGELDRYGNPESATLQYQDWFTPWEDIFPVTDEEQEALLEVASCFYYGGRR